MRQAGWQVVFLPGVAVVHLTGGTVKRFPQARSIERHRSRYRFFRKHRSVFALRVLQVGVFLRVLVTMLANGLLTAATLGRTLRACRRFQVAWSDLLWHLRGCPDGPGLRHATRRPDLEFVGTHMAELARLVPRAEPSQEAVRPRRPMKLALIMKDYAPRRGGGERYFGALCEELLRRGHEVHAFVRAVETEPTPGLVLHLVGGKCWWTSRALGSVVRGVARAPPPGRFDATVALTQVREADLYRVGGGLQRVWERIHHPASVGRWLARLFRPRRRALLRLEDRLIARSLCQRIITNSALVREQVLREYGLPSAMVDVVYNGVDLEQFSPRWRRERDAVRLGLGIEADAPVVLFAANNFGRKGLPTLLRGLELVRRVLPEVRLVVAGGGRLKPFAQLARRLGVEDAIRFLGERRDIHRLYAASDIFVLPTLYDPCANVCLEALASGTPVITTLDNGAAEFIRPGETGYLLADAKDHRELARLLVHFFTRGDRDAMSTRARQSMEGFTYKAHVDRLEAIVDELPKFAQVGELTVDREYAELFRRHRLDRFEALAGIQPVLSDRTKRGRRLARFELVGADGANRRFHLKAHRLRLRDVFRPLLSLARPVTANADPEWWGMRKLPRLGVLTATPVAFASRRRWGLEWQGLTVSADLAGCISLEDFLQRRIGLPGERPAAQSTFLRNLIRELAGIARTLHRAGINHQDFYLGHFFISAERPLEGRPKLFLVDLQRLQQRARVPRRYVVKDLGQLLYSAQQFPQFSRTDALRFLRFYRKQRHLSPASKRLGRAVIRKARTIARHTARRR